MPIRTICAGDVKPGMRLCWTTESQAIGRTVTSATPYFEDRRAYVKLHYEGVFAPVRLPIAHLLFEFYEEETPRRLVMLAEFNDLAISGHAVAREPRKKTEAHIVKLDGEPVPICAYQPANYAYVSRRYLTPAAAYAKVTDRSLKICPGCLAKYAETN